MPRQPCTRSRARERLCNESSTCRRSIGGGVCAQVYTRWLTSEEKPWLEELESLEVGARWWPQGVGSPRFQSRYSIPRLISTGWLAVSSIIGPNSCYVSATRGARPMPLPVQPTPTRISLCSICAYACLSFHVGYVNGCFASVQSR